MFFRAIALLLLIVTAVEASEFNAEVAPHIEINEYN